MRELVTEGFNKGIYNIIDSENIPQNAAQDSKNWRSVEDKIEFGGGKKTLGTQAIVGTGVTNVLYVNVDYKELYRTSSFENINQEFGFLKRVGTKLYFWVDDGGFGNGTWNAIPIVGTTNTDLFSADEIVHFKRETSEYSSLAGRFIYIVGSKSNIYKLDPYILNQPTYAFVTRVYDASKNFLGDFFFDKSRTVLFGREQDPTGEYLSKIDPQGVNYTTVTGETLTITGSKVNTRLVAAAANEKRHVFGIVVTTPVGTFRDDKKGGFVNTSTGASIPRYDDTLTAANPIGATIVYNTGQILISFNPVQTGTCTVNYQWEDPTIDGVWDFTFSIPRLDGEGDIVRQDAGGDPILNVLPYRGVYYTIKNTTAYQLTLSTTGNVETNTIFARNLGIESRNAIIATDTGIVYIDTSDKRFPRLKILKNLEYGGVIEPVEIAEHFRFADYDYEFAYFEIYNNNILISCRTLNAKLNNEKNDTVLFYDMRNNAVSSYTYRTNVLTTGGSVLYGGDNITEDVFTMLQNYSNDGLQIDNYWIGKDERYDKEFLKTFKWLRIKGRIGIDTNIKVYIRYDNAAFQWVGTILGNGTYVDQAGQYQIGGFQIGNNQIGGGNRVENSQEGNPYFCELKIYSPKFRVRAIKFEVEGLNYASVDLLNDNKINFYENRMPRRFRSKANLSLAGTTNNPLPNYAP